MGQVIKVWTSGMNGAKALKSEEMYEEAIVNFELMRRIFPGERAISKLMPLTAHW